MSKKPDIVTPVHRFASAGDVNFKYVRLTEVNFEEPDVEHRHGYWTIFLFLEGRGKHLIDFREVKIKPGSIHFVLPGQIHALHGGKGFLGYALMFTEEFFLMREETILLLTRLFGFMDAGELAVFDISKSDEQFFNHLIQLIGMEYGSAGQHKGVVLLDLLSVFVSKCMEALQLPKLQQSGDDSLHYIRLRREVDKHYRSMHTVAEYSDLLGLTPRQINELCRNYTGHTALEFIHQRLIVESKRLLRYSTKPVKQIAYDLNFTDAAHFANFFKQKTGHTPLEFKAGNMP